MRNNNGRRRLDNLPRYTFTAVWLAAVAGFLVGIAI